MASSVGDKVHLAKVDKRLDNAITAFSIIAVISLIALVSISAIVLVNGSLGSTVLMWVQVGAGAVLGASVLSLFVLSFLRTRNRDQLKALCPLFDLEKHHAYYSGVLLKVSNKIATYKKNACEAFCQREREAFENLVKELEQQQALLITRINRFESIFQQLKDLDESISNHYRDCNATEAGFHDKLRLLQQARRDFVNSIL